MKSDGRFEKGHAVPKEWRNAVSKSRKGHIPWNKGKPWSQKTKKKISLSKTGVSIRHSGQFKKGFTPWNKGKGNKTTISKKLRTSNRFKEWRKAVFERDDYTCQMCKQRGKKLHPHHIKRFADYPNLRFAISNGQTLCETCHRNTSTFGNRNLTTRHTTPLS